MKRSDAPYAICVSDAETSGVDIENDRIITFYAMMKSIKGETLAEKSWVIDPGIDIPQGASDVHGMTTEWVRENGRKDVSAAIHEIAEFHFLAANRGYPIVGYNHSFDLGMLDRELRRYNRHADLSGSLQAATFFDPIVYDRAMDKYRKGGRKLMDVARHHGIPIDESRLHEAQYDVEVTSRLAWLLLKKSPYTVDELQDKQLAWKSSWAEHLTEYFASQGKTEEDGSPIQVDGSFPWKKETA